MSTLRKRQIRGHRYNINPAVGVPPGHVGSIQASSLSSNTINVSYTAASGSPTITYQGWTSPHGANTWTLNAGTFTSTGGTFINLTQSTNYDLRIVAINNFGSTATDYLIGVTTLASGSAPSTVGSFMPGTATSTTIPVTYTAATGTAPITYSAYYSLHGTNTWIFDGTFSSTGGLYIGLSPSTNYDLKINASNAYGSTDTTYLTGVVTAAAPSLTLNATRIDIVPDKSSGPIGTTGNVTIYPNATWQGDGTKSVTVAGTGITGGSATIPTSGSTALTIPYTITANGELSFVVTNNGSLANPYSAPFNAFSASAGSAQGLGGAISSTPGNAINYDLQIFQRDTPSGNPVGWSTVFNKGWGEIWVALNLSTNAAAIYAKLVDADTGAYLQSTPVQVYGSLPSGSRTIRIIVPASNKRYYIELASDNAWTTPVRLTQRFAVGVVFMWTSASQQKGLVDSDPYGNHETTGVSYTRTVTSITGGAVYYGFYPMPAWFPHDNNPQTTSSSGAQEFGRLIENQLGVLCGLAGVAADGIGADTMMNGTTTKGAIQSGSQLTMQQNVTNQKFRYALWNMVNGAGAGFDFAGAIAANPGWMATNGYPACAISGYNYGGSGYFGQDGSSTPNGYMRNSILAITLSWSDPRVASIEDYHWNYFPSGHSSMAGRVQFARTIFRSVMDTELLVFGGNQTSNRGPRLTGTGSISNSTSSRIIRLPYKHYGGSSLSSMSITDSTSPTYSYANDVTAAELCALVAIYGPNGRSGVSQAIKITSVVINTASPPTGADGTLDVTLAGSSGITYADNTTASMPASLMAHFACDFGISGGIQPGAGRCAVLVDNQIDSGNGIPFGKHMKPLVDIVVSVV